MHTSVLASSTRIAGAKKRQLRENSSPDYDDLDRRQDRQQSDDRLTQASPDCPECGSGRSLSACYTRGKGRPRLLHTGVESGALPPTTAGPIPAVLPGPHRVSRVSLLRAVRPG